MDLSIPEEVLAYAASARRILSDENLERSRRAMDGDEGAREISQLQLRRLGIDELGDPHVDEISALAAAYLAMEAGRVAAPIPVVQRLAARAADRDGLLHAIGHPSEGLLVDHAHFPSEHSGVGPDGRVHALKVTGRARPERQLAPFAASSELREVEAGQVRWWCWHEVYSSFHTLGTVRAATDLYISHTRERVQFGRPLASFQAIQQRLAEIVVLRDGLAELAHWALWSLRTVTDDAAALATALAVRSHQLEVGVAVLRASQQVHGATGVCYEHPQAVLQRAWQVRRQLPMSRGATRSMLAEHVHALPRLVRFGR